MKRLTLLAGLSVMIATPAHSAQNLALPQKLDSIAASAMQQTGARGLAIAVVERGQTVAVKSWGERNVRGEPLTTDTIMYGASLTKAMFGWTVMQMVDEGKIDLDRPIANYLPKPLPEYAGFESRYSNWPGLAGDERWRKLTPRILLTHSSGFSNFWFLEPDGKLRIHFEPGSRYSYSGDGMILLQFVIEQGLRLDLGQEMQRRVFDRFGMKNSSMVWRSDFAQNLADGWKADGVPEPHDERSKTRAAGSLDTSISDFARFAAAYARGDGLSARARKALTKAQLPIRTASQFPILSADAPPAGQIAHLAAGLGVVTFKGPQGRGFFKGGHNDSTGNMWVCVERRQRCIVILANDVRAEAAFPMIVREVLGETGVPWHWEYGDVAWAKPIRR
jgi:CubicO group peptidase (beta-lactamase class C family)